MPWYNRQNNAIHRLAVLAASMALSACTIVAAPPETPEVLEAIATQAPTELSVAVALSSTPTLSLPTETPPPTTTPSPSPVPSDTPTPRPTVPPTAAPLEELVFTFDNWETLTLPRDLAVRLRNPQIAFLNTNNRTASAATPRPGNNIETLYYVPPTNSSARIALKEFDVSTGGQVYIAPGGDALAYMRLDGGSATNGLYIADFNVGVSGRVLPIETLTQRGFFSEPAWKADGTQIAIALASGYDLDIFTISRDGAWAPLITTGSYDFWPRWSPDGAYLAFASDRVTCPSWRPGDPATCEGTGAEAPTGGHVFVLEVATGRITQVSDAPVFEPPRWITPRQVAYATGDPLFGEPERAIYLADIFSGQVRNVRLPSNDPALKLAEAWAPGGQSVLFQAAQADSTAIVLAQANGAEIGRIDDLPFARYGMAAAWSPDGTRLAIGGVGGQCPSGVVVTDAALGIIARGNPPPSMCEPAYSPDGAWLAFTGVIANRDGRLDIYVAGNNGFGAINLTGSLLGNIEMIGWVGGQG